MNEILNSFWRLREIIGKKDNCNHHREPLERLVHIFFTRYCCLYPEKETEIFLLAHMLETQLIEFYEELESR